MKHFNKKQKQKGKHTHTHAWAGPEKALRKWGNISKETLLKSHKKKLRKATKKIVLKSVSRCNCVCTRVPLAV